MEDCQIMPRTTYGLREWVIQVHSFMNQNNLESFLYSQLPNRLQNNSMLRRASSRGYIRKINKIAIDHGDRRVEWIIAKGV